MPTKINFNYLNRDFASVKEDLKNYVQVYYPDQYNDFAESSVGMMLLELNAYVCDILSYHVDKNFGEVFLDSAKNRDSVIRLAQNLGYEPRGKTGAVTLLDVSIVVPVNGDTYDTNYLITIEKGMRAKAKNGTLYEVLEDVNFASNTSISGTRNRTIVPNYNSSNEILDYTVTKTVTAIAGEAKIKTLEVTPNMAVPFMKWHIDDDDTNVIEIMNMVSKDTRFPPDTEQAWVDGTSTIWYQVPSLPQESVFVDTSISGTGAEGYWMYTAERFISSYDQNGNVVITFGAGIKDYDNYSDFIDNGISGMSATALLNNDSLGTIPEPGQYLHVRYRTGGGAQTNAAQGTITQIQHKNITNVPGGPALPVATVSAVKGSVAVTNPIPAIGGKEFETVDEIKHYAKNHFSSQDRVVTVDDYISRIALLPQKYGTVFRSYARADEKTMNTSVYILTRDENGHLKNTGNEQVKYNIAAYLQNYKLLNDFVIINDGRIINLGIKFTLQISAEYNKKEVLANAIRLLTDYFAVENWQMNDALYISQVSEMLRAQPGIVNVVQLDFYNKVGNGYSLDVLGYGQGLGSEDLLTIGRDGEIAITPINNAIRSPITGMFEIKYPNVDIMGAAL